MTISSFMEGKVQKNYCGVQLKTGLLGNKIKVRQNGFAPMRMRPITWRAIFQRFLRLLSAYVRQSYERID